MLLVTSGKKRRAVDPEDRPISKRQLIQDEVDEINIHSCIRNMIRSTHLLSIGLWANMIQVGTHKHYDTPPNVPMSGISAKAGAPKGTNLGEALSSVAEGLMRVWTETL